MAMDDQPIFNSSPEKQLMLVMATSTSFSAEREPSLRAGQPAPSNLPAQDIMQYGPQRVIQKRISEALQPFATAERSRESNPRRIFGEMKMEMEQAEQRSNALESEIGEALIFFRAREAWWTQNLQELHEDAGSDRSRFEQLASTAVSEFRERMTALEDTASRSHGTVLASEQSIQQYQQNLLTLESYTQRLQEEGASLVGQSEATARSLTDKVSYLEAEQAKLEGTYEQNRVTREATMELAVQQRDQTVVSLRTELDFSQAAVATTNDQIKMVVRERDRFQADLQQARAITAGKHADTSSLEVRLTETQAAHQQERLRAEVLVSRLEFSERQTELDQQRLYEARTETENFKNQLDQMERQAEINMRNLLHAQNEAESAKDEVRIWTQNMNNSSQAETARTGCPKRRPTSPATCPT